PYLRGLEPATTRLLQGAETPLTPLPALERLLGPLLRDGARLVERWLGGSAAVARRLRQAGVAADVTRFRAEQVLWGLAGFAAGVLVTLGLPALAGRPVSAMAVVGGAVVGVLGGILGRDGWLGRQVARRQAQILRELPTLTDLLCLAVTAGEGPRAALDRTVARSHGELSRELAMVLADVRAGEPFTTAMERLAVRVPIPAVVRFVDGLVVATERGTPLGDVLRAQAADVREQHKRDLIEAGGRREVLMLVPVVFLELPVVILFVLYPGLVSLSQIAR
ncbi:MAG TPA: type II secretion system F family protein, partial [Actinomycetes bacterium]|nr:type II secretion system F family protein [Actinomycetes bacterium]